ncbi:MAG: DUF2892 domain-containing protein [Candidatus Altiarchaeota archaeon]
MKLTELLAKENVGGYDLMVRALAGTLAMIALALGLSKPPVTWILALIAFAGIFTSLTRHCTPYVLLGFNTARK